ncbi:MAG: 50S ribosomal protein L30 [Paramuribaculum sp.]|nr:50S ribosomal protein L30 [Candidatus Amulumruptor sp.]MDE6545932.1 50S ribosomal protein L30 [Paramuribaculum sp.]MDE6587454.1 50S ribosomal protein L30 [Paramuribaculum sp.]MDE7150914.1 50S ribosomal protein L30 [Candidatus Amulumruptor sp.]
MAQIKITQTKSRINAPAVQKRTLDALGLKKMNHSVVKEDTPSIRGMVEAVHHLVTVENV